MGLVMVWHQKLETNEQIEPEEFIAYVEAECDPSDSESLIAASLNLVKLAMNKSMLVEHINEQIKAVYANEPNLLASTSQTLFTRRFGKFVLRVNIWPELKSIGPSKPYVADLHAYYLPHNHVFNMLTTGYWGSGYDTEVLETNQDLSSGYIGMKIEFGKELRARLGCGDVLYMEHGKDFHTQYPPSDFSASLNLLAFPKDMALTPQYCLDMRDGSISAFLESEVEKCIHAMDIAGMIGDGNTLDLLIEIARNTNITPVRAHALNSAAWIAMKMKKAVLPEVFALAGGRSPWANYKDTSDLIRF